MLVVWAIGATRTVKARIAKDALVFVTQVLMVLVRTAATS
jgi:hypothetical protein